MAVTEAKIPKAKRLITEMSKRHRVVNLFFSCGKDSIALLDMMDGHFEKINLIFMYFVKDLGHIDRYLEWAKSKNNVEVHQVPHWILSYIYKEGVYCQNIPTAKLIKLSDVCDRMIEKTGSTMSILGMKKADSMNRRLYIGGLENGIDEKNKKAYPLFDLTDKEIIAYIKMRRLPQPIRYAKKSSNGVTFNRDVYLYLQKHHPEDLAKIIKKFPLSEEILYKDAAVKVPKVRNEAN